jgi:predicted signal transduction protein with EAL and GGDEF domain
MIGGKEVHPRASIRVVSGQLGALHPETLLAEADLAMYFAKRAGKGGYRVFNETMRTDLLDRLELGEDLRGAIEATALEVAYQAIIDLKTGPSSASPQRHCDRRSAHGTHRSVSSFRIRSASG